MTLFCSPIDLAIVGHLIWSLRAFLREGTTRIQCQIVLKYLPFCQVHFIKATLHLHPSPFPNLPNIIFKSSECQISFRIAPSFKL